jgi:tRNA-dihydrouridine synthase 3
LLTLGYQYPFPFSDRYLKHAEPQKEFTLGKKPPKKSKVVSEEDAMNGEEAALNVSTATEVKGVVDGQAESLDVPLRPEEKRSLNWENGLYLAPLTTNGNLVSNPHSITTLQSSANSVHTSTRCSLARSPS